jgi:RNase P protein component
VKLLGIFMKVGQEMRRNETKRRIKKWQRMEKAQLPHNLFNLIVHHPMKYERWEWDYVKKVI